MFEVSHITITPIGDKLCHRWKATIHFMEDDPWTDERTFLSPEAAAYSAKREIRKRFYKETTGTVPKGFRNA